MCQFVIAATRAEVQAMLDIFNSSVAANDVKAIGRLYNEDCMIMAPGDVMRRGRKGKNAFVN